MSSELNVYLNTGLDFEFLGFTFNGRHSSEFALTVVSPSDFLQNDLFANFEDKLVEVDGKDGSYYFGTKIKTKGLSVSLAFDNLSGKEYRDILNWLNPKTVGKLIFDEKPYKYYIVKIATTPIINYVPFEYEINNIKTHVFKGTIDIGFIAYDPYAYGEHIYTSTVPIWNGTTFIYPYEEGVIPGWYLESGLLNEEDLSIVPIDYTLVDGIPIGYTFTNVSNTGPIQIDVDLNADFYNAGTVETNIDFTLEVAEYLDILVLQNLINQTKFEILSLQNIIELKAVMDAKKLEDQNNTEYTSEFFWIIKYDSKKMTMLGQLKEIRTHEGPIIEPIIYTKEYNLGGLTSGILNLSSGSNSLQCSHNLMNFKVFYKHKYW